MAYFLLPDGVCNWGDEYVVDALRKLIPFLFRSFYNWLIFKLKKIDGIKTGSELASLSVTFSSAQFATPSVTFCFLIIIPSCRTGFATLLPDGVCNPVRDVLFSDYNPYLTFCFLIILPDGVRRQVLSVACFIE